MPAETVAPAEEQSASAPSVSVPTTNRPRHPSEQRYIIRQTAIKCATDLVAARQVKIEALFSYAGRIVAWIYSSPQDPEGKKASG